MTRKRYIHALTLTVLAALTAACTADEREPAGRDICEPMLLSVGQGGMTVDRTTRGHSTTPAYNGGYTFAGTEQVKIGVTGVSGSTRSTSTEQLKVYTAASGTNTVALSILPATDQFYWMSTSEQVSLRAWSYGTSDAPADIPTTGDDAGKLSFTLPATQTAADVKELLYAKAATYDYATYHAGITLDFYHQLSRVVINVKRDNTSDAISSVVIGDGSTTVIPTTATFAIPTGASNLGTWSGQGTAVHTVTPKTWTAPNITTGYEQTLSAVLIPGDYTGKFIAVATGQGTFYYTLTSTLTLDPGKQYTFNIEVRNQKLLVDTDVTDWDDITATTVNRQLPPDDIRKNPLWYVAEYNMTNPKNAVATMGTAANQGYFYSWADAMAMFSTGNASGETGYYNGGKYVNGAPAGSTWHLPTLYEMNSIIPGNKTVESVDSYVDVWSLTDTDGQGAIFQGDGKTTNVCFGYNETTKGTSGTYMQENSYWYRKSANEWYAIRYCESDYCSAWKYVWADNDKNEANPATMTIYCTLLGCNITAAQAEALFGTTDANWNTIYFGNDESRGAQMRTFAARGVLDNSSGATPSTSIGNTVNLWTATFLGTHYSWGVNIIDNATYHLMNINGSVYENGRNVRLFRDNITDARPAPVCTVDQIQAGISTNYEVGDVVCQDGSIYRYDGTNDITAAALAEKAGRKPVGIIVYKCAATPTYTDLQVTEGMGHALVMGINDISTDAYAWSGSDAATGWENETYGSPELFPDKSSGSTNIVVAQCVAEMRGLEKTNVLANHLCNAGHRHPAYEQLKTWREQTANQVNFKSTDWFVPAMGQWLAACSAMIARQGHTYTPVWVSDDVSTNTEDVVQVICTEAGAALKWGGAADCYHSTSEGESGGDKIVCIGFAQGGSGHSGIRFGVGRKDYTWYIRPFLAF